METEVAACQEKPQDEKGLDFSSDAGAAARHGTRKKGELVEPGAPGKI